ncbi:hypothetical protein [Actinacidiphila sp. ITFR-21]|nr:hypothetical protein [Streptomyces sp. ITFR-21]WNI20359.1 hypothetical protein RLT57_32670 [Streptomyces sp. ITFR-21]
MSAADEQDKARDDYRNGAAQRDPQAVKDADADARAGGSNAAGSERS